MHLIITDSGLGGLSVCASIENALRERASAADVRITYVDVWPEEGRGYNDLPDPAARARVFDRALDGIEGLRPDLVLIACNTLSILYDLTAFRRRTTIEVQGIVEAGVELFHEAMAAEPESALVLLGTRTTIESGVHRERLVSRGVGADRIAAVSCHGLAAAIERGPDTAAVDELIEECAERAAAAMPAGNPLFAGLCCTHYGMVSERISTALARTTGRLVGPLDPNDRLVLQVMPRLAAAGTAPHEKRSVPVSVISKINLDERQREGVARIVEATSPVTAAALRNYMCNPRLF